MAESRILSDVKVRLEKLNIYELRQVARAVGVHRPADGKKSRVLEEILSIAQGVTAPEPPASRGAPPKSRQYDEQLVADIKVCREYYLAFNGGEEEPQKTVLSVSDSVAERTEKSLKNYIGVLDLSGKNAFLRGLENGGNGEEVFVHETFITRFSLRYGDLIECRAMRRSDDEMAGFVEVLSVGGVPVTSMRERRHFSELTHIYPAVNIKTAVCEETTACRMIDLFTPLALGQRAFISAPQRAGKTTLLKQIASGICGNYRDLEVIVLLMGARPEEITDFKRSVSGCKMFYTSFDMTSEYHIRTARLAVEYARRQTEYGKNTLIIFDGMYKLYRSFSSETAAQEQINKILYSACNAEEGGSLTVLSAISPDMPNYSELMSIASMVINLSGELAARRVFPAIDVSRSFSDGDENFLTKNELNAANAMRAMPIESVISIFKENLNNNTIIEKFG